MTWFRCAMGGGNMPSWMEINEQTLTEDSLTSEIPFDKTRVVCTVVQYMLDSSISNNSTTGLYARKKVADTSYIWHLTQVNGQGTEAGANSGCTLTVDYETGKITATTSARPWRSGKTYRTIITYVETT